MCWRVWPRFSHLLYDPKSTWVSRDLEAEDLPPVVTDDKEAIQNTKGERRHREEVHRCNRLAMIAQEGEPALRRIGSSRSAPKPSRDRRLGEIETQLEQLPVNARRSPGWILRRHTKDQSPNLRAHTFPAAHSPSSREPSPAQPKACSMPSHNRFRCDQHERLLPAGPQSSQNNPEQLMRGRQSATRSLDV